ncbi:DNA-binding Lrp family transcriptional regulator [Desulfitispora alkaliphila]|uniref:siroheme decarboxylase subunit beta n=1 Tax=Desulfitispora alkaliphila TaxID=622674 RepID=UPI003D24C12C
MNITELDKDIIRKLQGDLPLSPEPFKEIAQSLDISEEELLEKIRLLKEQGIIRRFGAALRHREAGYKANAMVVWEVEEEKALDMGQKMAQFPEVTHCYKRRTYPGWPYNLFTMVHGTTKEQCYQIAERINEAVDAKNYKLLFSTKELKKTSMKYFVE